MAEKKPLESQLKEWLETQGYPLEMEVAQEFREHGFRVGQGAYYHDPDTKEPREIDVVASRADVIGNLQVFLTCFISCKLSRYKPWVLFSTERGPQDLISDFYSMVASRLGSQLLFALKRPEYGPLPRALDPTDRMAYGLTQGLRKEKTLDVAYGAVMSAAKAAVSRATAGTTEYEENEPVVEVMIPTVLIDDLLFEYYLDKKGTKRLSEMQWGRLTLGNPITGRNQSTLVHVVTKEGMPDFVMALDELYAHLQIGAKEHEDKLVQSWEGKKKEKELSIAFFPLTPP